MFDERNKAVFRYVRMWRQVLTLKELEIYFHISDSTFHLWEHGLRGATLEQVATLALYGKCTDKVILGYEPCTAKCPHCKIAQS